MFFDEAGGVGARFGVDDIGDVALLPKLHVLGLVAADQFITHPRKQIAQLLRVGVGEFDELEPVGAGGVFIGDGGFRGVVGERTHGNLLSLAFFAQIYAGSRGKFAHSKGFLAPQTRRNYPGGRNHARNAHMLDPTDLRLLNVLQKDAHLTAQELGEMLNLSPSQAGRRRQRLEAEGYIKSYVARVAPDRLGLAIQAFVQVQLGIHGPEPARDFARLINSRSEVTGAWTLTGEADYLLRVYCADLSALHRLIHEVLMPHPSVTRVQSQIVMDQLKQDGPLPTDTP